MWEAGAHRTWSAWASALCRGLGGPSCLRTQSKEPESCFWRATSKVSYKVIACLPETLATRLEEPHRTGEQDPTVQGGNPAWDIPNVAPERGPSDYRSASMLPGTRLCGLNEDH